MKTDTTPQDIEQALREVGIVGFDTDTDAIRDTRVGRIYYIDDGEIHWTDRSSYQDKWLSPATMKPEHFVRALSDVDQDDIRIIDKTVFNRLVSGPLDGITHAHDGIAWGISVMCGHSLDPDETPNYQLLRAVPGVGKTLSGKIIDNFDTYTKLESGNTYE